MKLRDGSETTDPRFGRLEDYDARNLNFLAAAPLEAAGKRPRSYTWRVAVKADQRAQGSCVGHAWAHELVARPKVWDFTAGRMPAEQGTHRYAVDLYYAAQRIDPWPGGEYPGASPAMAGTSVLAAAKILRERGVIGAYRWAYTVDDLALAVGHAGPAVIGVPWYEGMVNPDDNGFIHTTGRPIGGHAVLVHGVSQRRGLFKVTNSWGYAWGRNGECFIGFEDMGVLLRRNGEACIPDKRRFQRDVTQR